MGLFVGSHGSWGVAVTRLVTGDSLSQSGSGRRESPPSLSLTSDSFFALPQWTPAY